MIVTIEKQHKSLELKEVKMQKDFQQTNDMDLNCKLF